MHLHNRQLKAAFWNDPDLLIWNRDKRWFYEGLFHLADDSGCLENSTFAFKLNLFPSPMDEDITMDLLGTWRDEIIHTRKLVPYSAEGKDCLYIAKFHKHQTLKNPEKPDVPLPPWIQFKPYDSNPRTGKYTISYEVLTEFLRSSDKVLLIEVNRSEVNRSEVKTREDKEKGESDISTQDEVAVSVTKDSTNSSSSLDHEFGQVTTIYQEASFGPMNDIVREQLGDLCDEFTPQWVIEAMKESVFRNKRTMKYMNSILTNWRAEGGVKRSGGESSGKYRSQSTRYTESDQGAEIYIQKLIDSRREP